MKKEHIKESEYIHEQDKLRSAKISDSVIGVCAVNAALSTKGVVEASGDIADSISEFFLGKESVSKGVKVDQDKDGIEIDLFVIAEYGARIPDIAWNIQKNVKKKVFEMTDKKVKKVNVHVQGVAKR